MKKNQFLKIQISLIAAAVVAAFLLISMLPFIPGLSLVGEAMRGVFGVAIFAYCIFVLLVSIALLMGYKIVVQKQTVIRFALFFAAFIFLMHTLSSFAIFEGGTTFGQYLSAAYESQSTGGGVLFGIIVFPFLALLGPVITAIMFGLATAAALFFIILPFLKNTTNKVKEPALTEISESGEVKTKPVSVNVSPPYKSARQSGGARREASPRGYEGVPSGYAETRDRQYANAGISGRSQSDHSPKTIMNYELNKKSPIVVTSKKELPSIIIKREPRIFQRQPQQQQQSASERYSPMTAYAHGGGQAKVYDGQDKNVYVGKDASGRDVLSVSGKLKAEELIQANIDVTDYTNKGRSKILRNNLMRMTGKYVEYDDIDEQEAEEAASQVSPERARDRGVFLDEQNRPYSPNSDGRYAEYEMDELDREREMSPEKYQVEDDFDLEREDSFDAQDDDYRGGERVDYDKIVDRRREASYFGSDILENPRKYYREPSADEPKQEQRAKLDPESLRLPKFHIGFSDDDFIDSEAIEYDIERDRALREQERYRLISGEEPIRRRIFRKRNSEKEEVERLRAEQERRQIDLERQEIAFERKKIKWEESQRKKQAAEERARYEMQSRGPIEQDIRRPEGTGFGVDDRRTMPQDVRPTNNDRRDECVTRETEEQRVLKREEERKARARQEVERIEREEEEFLIDREIYQLEEQEKSKALEKIDFSRKSGDTYRGGEVMPPRGARSLSPMLNKNQKKAAAQHKDEQLTFDTVQPAAKRQIKPYKAPPINLLLDYPNEYVQDPQEIEKTKNRLEKFFEDFKIKAKFSDHTTGPTFTRYEMQMPPGVPVSRVMSLDNDISMKLATSSKVRIEAPIPGRDAFGIELPNRKRSTVGMRDLVNDSEFFESKGELTFTLGKDITGKNYFGDISEMPHLLIAGATGSGKSCCLNALIISLLYKYDPEEVKLILIDPKQVELSMYEGLPHLLLHDVVTDHEKVINSLDWAIKEMNKRYSLIKAAKANNISEYNRKAEKDQKLYRIVIVIDEVAELMLKLKREVEERIQSLAQLARAAGIHIVLATQRPSVDVITSVIRSNLPARAAFAVKTNIDSRIILNEPGAEKLLGKGDMLFQTQSMREAVRLQGVFISHEEISSVVEYVRENNEAYFDNAIDQEINTLKSAKVEKEHDEDEENEGRGYDDLFVKTVMFVINSGSASISLLQRKFAIGYARAARIIDTMEEQGIVSKADGSKPRTVLMSREQFRDEYYDLLSEDDLEALM